MFFKHTDLSWSCPVCWWAHQKHSSFQVQGFYFPAFFHRIATFLLTLPICTSMLSTFSASTSISFIVILNFLSDNFRIPAISEFGPEAYFVFQIVFLAFSMPFSFSLLRVRHDVLGNKNQVDRHFVRNFVFILLRVGFCLLFAVVVVLKAIISSSVFVSFSLGSGKLLLK